MSEWRECKLGDIADDVTVGFVGTMANEYVSSGITFLRSLNVKPYRIDLRDCKFITAKFNSRLSKSELHPGDVVIVRTGMPGTCAIIPETLKVSNCSDLVIVRPGPMLDNYFFMYYMNSIAYAHVQSHIVGAVQQHFNVSSAKDMTILLPPLPEQRAIAAILSSLDDKIDLLRRQNATLEALAETLFRQWFVEEADEGWEEGTVANLIEFNPTRKLVKGASAPYLEMAALSNSTFMPESWYDREFASGTKFMNGDTLLARITPCLENGKTAFITFLKDDQIAWGSTEYIVMRPKDPIHTFLAYVLSRLKDFRDYAEGCLEGSSGRQRVNVDHLMNYPMAIPDDNSIKRFNELAESVVARLKANAEEIHTLTALRDTLLPKLMSGEVRVCL